MPYTCSICGMWVMDNVMHICGGTPSPQLPPMLPVHCRAPFNPLSAAEIRLIVREEIERAFANKPATPSATEQT